MSRSVNPTEENPTTQGSSSREKGLSSEENTSTNEKAANPSEVVALSQLFRRTARYRRAEAYKRFLDFVGQFLKYSPYNAPLLHVQNPGILFPATRRLGRERFDRVPEPGARPYVILRPLGPVLFVYDLPDTEPRPEEGEQLPEDVTDPFAVAGELGERTWNQTLQNCREKEKVAVRRSPDLHRRHGDRVERRPFQAGAL